jgi:lipopolysaccharide export system permease protein
MNSTVASYRNRQGIGKILDRYLISGYLKTFSLCLLAVTGLYFVVDFFDRVDNLFRSSTPLWTAIRYFFFKLPLIVSRVLGFAGLFTALFFIGRLARTKEILAMRFAGFSLRRFSFPILLAAAGVSLLGMLWSETIVPIFARQAQTVYRAEVRKNSGRSLVGDRDIWLRGDGVFISVNRFDAKRRILEGVAVYLLNPDFSLGGFLEGRTATWNGTAWQMQRATEWQFAERGPVSRRRANILLPIAERPDDLRFLAREPEEFSFLELRRQIAYLRARGIDATEYAVDLQLKVTSPLASFLFVLLAIPFALKQNSTSEAALNYGAAVLVSLGYWLLLSFTRSLGHGGALPPVAAAWLPLVTLALVVWFFSTAEER